MMRSLLLLTLCLIAFAGLANAQEVDNNPNLIATTIDGYPEVCHTNPDFIMIPYNSDEFVDYNSFICSADSFEVSFKFKNHSHISFSGNLKISFYNGDPRQRFRQSTYLGTKSVSVSGIASTDTMTMTLNVKNPGGSFNLYIAVNDDGSTFPLDIPGQPSRVNECEYYNVINMHIEPRSAHSDCEPDTITFDVGEEASSVKGKIVEDGNDSTVCCDSAHATLRLKKNLAATEEQIEIGDISAYPNPGTDIVTVVIENDYIGEVKVQLQSTLGNEIHPPVNSYKRAQRITIPFDAATVRSGVYLVEVSLGNQTQYLKWIKR